MPCCCNTQAELVIGNFLYVIQKLIGCFAFTLVITCVMATLMAVLGLGFGLGYNTCVIEVNVTNLKRMRTTPTTAASKRRYMQNDILDGGNTTTQQVHEQRSKRNSTDNKLGLRTSLADSDYGTTENGYEKKYRIAKTTVDVPLLKKEKNENYSVLISKIRAGNKKHTL